MEYKVGDLVWIVSGESIWQAKITEVKPHTGRTGGYMLINGYAKHYADAEEVYRTAEEARASILVHPFQEWQMPCSSAFAIRTAEGYFAHQHNHDWSTTKWFEKEPVGWAQIASETEAKQVAQYYLSDTEYTIEKISI